ncbi:MAG: hydroxymethylglutaryl-CoA reductase, degradative [Sulfolobales archaeon]|nr:hydroxymethylglutaryl-CoA reductase, degradative [Sulfolobales archaeon]MCX8186095.1 hydroxymethylglutaryl-CoA reductase, degradative [Sulfolobales archaeon]MDW7969390.1 hydroxymethylglutaryl-CoA reductase, degradative [Sulfolobales archaeon]
MSSSRIPNFYRLNVDERAKIIKELTGLTDDELNILKSSKIGLSIADKMIENVIGTFELPLGVATNFLINNKDYLIPMVIEEPSVVAAASNAARMCREGGGLFAVSTESIMFSQIQVVGVTSPHTSVMRILQNKDEILRIANEKDPILYSLGGGAKDLEVRLIHSSVGTMIVIHLIVDVKDAMGANAVNTMAEAVAPYIEKITGGKVLLRIISNLADKRLVKVWTKVPKEAVGGPEIVDGIVYAWAFAASDPYRAATHNKGIMNGVIAVGLATGQDTRALEAGAHAYASKSGKYTTLSTWEKNEDGDLVGYLEMPMAVGVVGGATRVNPLAKISLKILGVKTARELAEVMGSVGLAQNLAALRALVSEGIQKGHMKLHARQIAIAVGAQGDEVDKVVSEMVKSGVIRIDKAKEILSKLRGN